MQFFLHVRVFVSIYLFILSYCYFHIKIAYVIHDYVVSYFDRNIFIIN